MVQPANMRQRDYSESNNGQPLVAGEFSMVMTYEITTIKVKKIIL